MTAAGPGELLESLLEPVWLVDSRTLRILAVNQAACDLVGLSADTLTGLPAIELASAPEDLFFWEDVAAGLAVNIQSHTLLRGVDGQAIPVERKVSRAWLPGPLPVYVVALRDLRPLQAQEQAVETQLAEMRATLESSTDGILVVDLEGGVRHLNRSLADMWSLDVEAITRGDVSDVPARMTAALLDSRQSRPDDNLPHELLQLRSGRVLERTVVPQVSRHQKIGWVHAYRDVTAQRLTDQALRLAAKVFASSPDAIFITDAQYRIVQANPCCLNMMLWTPEGLSAQSAEAVFFDPQRPHLFADIEMSLLAEGRWSGEVWRRGGAAAVPVEVLWFLLRDPAGAVCNTVVHCKDISERHEARQHIERLAYRDALTGLANRSLLAQRVEHALRVAGRNGGQFAILFLDLDRFKNINDTLGHAFGDRVLLEVSERIQLALRDVDTLCRMGGDEFVAYLHDADGAGAEMAARRILEALRQPYSLDGMPFTLGCSIGISLYPADGETLDALIQCADTAMYRAKERGRGDLRFYQPQMNVDLLSRMRLDHAMRKAMEQQRFHLHYQPQISLTDGRLLGAEALLRWTDPELGVVSPAEFIPLAEESGFIVPLGQWVMQAAVQQAALWASQGMPVCISVNVSPLQFQQSDFVDRVAQCIAQAGLPPALLELELTESILVRDANEALSRLHALHRLGVTLAIDDFGTGYSSLAYLKKFPISKLKIDRTFITGLPEDESDRAIVSATIAMAKALRLTVVAEGVETTAQRDFLTGAHCTSFQGFLCAPGLAADAFARLATGLIGQPRGGDAAIAV
ncbi:bifunctional diguanylate cyclase/phosphodiesterase [Rhodoferax sp.]|uniref:sensor domain-containing protein n=1 Tax=Rhodoferax sp. TaxID=50421 RepID=UPI0025CF28EB|nr:bifunctional diguanylate cyclase/phosphodiesterase [Rhodoferax sp.]